VDGPGLWQFTVTQSWSDDSFDPTSTSTYFYVPDVPDLTGMHSIGDYIYEFTGYGTTNDQVEVVSGNPGNFTVVCGPVTVSYYGWYCDTGSPDLNATYWAIQIDTGDCSGVGCDVSPYQDGALSPPSTSITYFPSVDFQARPAGSHLVANPGVGSNGANVAYAMWQTFAGDGGSYSDWGGYSGQPSCSGDDGTIPGTNTCDTSGLTPGYYQYSVWQDSTDGEVDRYFTVPSTPSLAVTPSGSGRAVLSGSVAADVLATIGDPVHVLVDGSSPKCDGSSVAANGTWSCIITGLKAGSHTFQAFVEDANTGNPDIGSPDHVTGGLSAGSSIVSATIHVTGGTTPTESPTPFPDWFFTVTGVDLNNVHPGDTFTVTGSGLPPGSTVSGELHSKAVSIGSAVVQPDGTFSLPVTVPADFPAGAHTIVMTLTPPGSSAVSSQQPLKVVPASLPSTDGTPTPNDSPSPLGSSEGPGIDNHGPNSNILTHGLNSIADVLAHPAKIPAAIEIGLVLLIFAVLPGHLLNATLAEQYERFTKRRSQRKREPGRWARLVAFLHRAPFVAGLALTTATALLFGFADPRFGFSLASLRLFLGLAIALAIVSYLTNAVVGRIMRGRWKVDVEVSLRPLGVILTVAGVVVSRVLDFSPGFLIGLVLGLVISEKHLAKQAWRAVLLRSSILLGLALLAWLAFSLFDASEEGGTFVSELAVETLVAITTEAVVGLLVELLPLKLLEGEKLYEKSKVLWGALYLLAVFIFVVAVVPWEGNWAQLGTSLWTWIGIVVGFGIVATGVYLYFRIRGHEEHEEHVITDEDGDKLVPIGSEDDER
jgi:MFS family permease